MEDLGFAKRDDEGDLYIPVVQLSHIINIDKLCLSLDVSNGQRGGRPEAVFYCPSLPETGRDTVKSSLTTTLITGSTAAGEDNPPHFQFSTKAQTAEMDILRVELVAYMYHVRGKFGAQKDQAWPINVGMNSRGGMDDVEFEYLSNSLIPLYPVAKDVKGKRVLFKLDSGPGRLGMNLLARLCLLGFVSYPGVPNTTTVSQETNRNYSPFKTAFRMILDRIFQERMFKKNKNGTQSVACWSSCIWWGGPGDWSISVEECLPRRILEGPVPKGLG